MRFHVVTIFPAMFDGLLDVGVLKRAINNRLIEVNLTDIRDFTTDSIVQSTTINSEEGLGCY